MNESLFLGYFVIQVPKPRKSLPPHHPFSIHTLQRKGLKPDPNDPASATLKSWRGALSTVQEVNNRTSAASHPSPKVKKRQNLHSLCPGLGEQRQARDVTCMSVHCTQKNRSLILSKIPGVKGAQYDACGWVIKD